MWAEIILSRDDLTRLLEQAFPLTIQLGDAEAEHSLSLTDLGEVRLVADVGVRIVCKARVHWPVLGIELPVALSSLTLVLLPTIGQGAEGDTLVFRVSIEHADFAGLPTMIDTRITEAINAKLAEKEAELAWNFSKALAYEGPLPSLLDPLESFAIHPAWGKVRITDEAVVYAASFHSTLGRRGEHAREDVAPAAPPVTPARALATRPRRTRRGLAASPIVAAGVFGLAAGAAYFALRAGFRSV
jgi:hypothetical protein